MSKRLQVVVSEEELAEIREAARRERLTVSEWARQALRAARGRSPRRAVDDKLEALRRAVAHDAPTGDVDEMLGDIARGYLGADDG